jgi:hypothetical protein
MHLRPCIHRLLSEAALPLLLIFTYLVAAFFGWLR